MKYRLKKDLPFAKTGAEVILVDRTLTKPFYGIYEGEYEFGGQFFFVCYADEIKRLLSQGWIEEVKPREFSAIIQDDNKTLQTFQEITPNGRVGFNFDRDTHLGRIIKLIEVIE